MKIDKDNYDVRYYYIKNEKRNCPGQHSLACVCMVRNKSTMKISRGLSFCSTKEKFFNKMTARGLAYQRAVAADVAQVSHEMFEPTESTQYAVDTMRSKYGFEFKNGLVVKSDFDIVPTGYEVGVWDD
jgi:hypothetical protein